MNDWKNLATYCACTHERKAGRPPLIVILHKLAILATLRKVCELLFEVGNLFAESVNFILSVVSHLLVDCKLFREVSNLLLSFGELVIEEHVLLASPFVHLLHLREIVLYAINSSVE